MSSGTLILIELVLIIGVVLGLAVWQLRSVSPKRRRDDGPKPPDG